MKRWIVAVGLVMMLLVGTAVLLGVFFSTDLQQMFFAGSSTTGATASESGSFAGTDYIEPSLQIPQKPLPDDTTTDYPFGNSSTAPPSIAPIPDLFALSAEYAFVYDTDTEQFLHIKGDLDTRVAPASLTKLFSALVALEYMQPEEVVTIGEEISWVDSKSSMAWLQKGHKITVDMLIGGMMLPSGNDAAYALAVAAGRRICADESMSARNAKDAFVAQMNRQAQFFGLTDSNFCNPDGIDQAGHYMTMRDLVRLSEISMENAVIRKYACMAELTAPIESGHIVNWKNSNLLLHPESKYYISEAVGLKTGSTTKAGKCLLSAFIKEYGHLIVGVLGSPEDEQRYEDTIVLYENFAP